MKNKKLRNELVRKENEHRSHRYQRSWFHRRPKRVTVGTSGGAGAKILRGQKKRVFGSKAYTR